MRPFTRRQPEPIDRLLVTASRTAEHSALWLALAALAAAFGGKRGRRAAAHGVLAIALTSATINALKLVIARRRPAVRRRIRRVPRTTSFPSGHSASAAAFTVAVSRELPEAAPILLPLAATVAYSRVYLGVHYPSDVLAGGAVGAAFGVTARRAARRLVIDEQTARDMSANTRQGPEAVRVVSPHAGRSRGWARAGR